MRMDFHTPWSEIVDFVLKRNVTRTTNCIDRVLPSIVRNIRQGPHVFRGTSTNMWSDAEASIFLVSVSEDKKQWRSTVMSNEYMGLVGWKISIRKRGDLRVGSKTCIYKYIYILPLQLLPPLKYVIYRCTVVVTGRESSSNEPWSTIERKPLTYQMRPQTFPVMLHMKFRWALFKWRMRRTF